jgi:GntR family transcriptional regulator
LRLGDEQPIAIERVELPADWLPNLQRFDLQAQSLYKVLEEEYGIRLSKCREEIAAIAPDAAQRKLLQIDRSVALLVIHRQSCAVNGSPIEVSESAYRGDMYTASIDAVRMRAEC